MPRPGWKRITTLENGHEVTLNVREDAPAEPTQEELALEIEGAVSLGWKTIRLGRRGVRYELFLDLKRWGRSWRRYADGTIERMFDNKPLPKPEPLGAVASRPSEPQMFPAALEAERHVDEPNPFDTLDPATRAAVAAAMGLRR